MMPGALIHGRGGIHTMQYHYWYDKVGTLSFWQSSRRINLILPRRTQSFDEGKQGTLTTHEGSILLMVVFLPGQKLRVEFACRNHAGTGLTSSPYPFTGPLKRGPARLPVRLGVSHT